LVLGLVSYYWTVGPLERKLMEREVRGLAGEINTIINIRTTALGMAANHLDVDNLADTGALDELLVGIRRIFPDFLSMEIVDEHGEILAMLGELPLSEAGRVSRPGKSSTLGAAGLNELQVFSDDPSGSCFFITIKHRSGDGASWYSRNRFSRDPIEHVLESGQTSLPVKLFPIPAAERREPIPVTGSSSGVFSWWSRTDGLEASLAVPGWVVKLDRPTKRFFFGYVFVICLGLAALIAGSTYAFRRYEWVIDRNQWQSARSRSLRARTLVPRSTEGVPVSKSPDSMDAPKMAAQGGQEPAETELNPPCPGDLGEALADRSCTSCDREPEGTEPAAETNGSPADAAVNLESEGSNLFRGEVLCQPLNQPAELDEISGQESVSPGGFHAESRPEEAGAMPVSATEAGANLTPALHAPELDFEAARLDSNPPASPMDEIPEFMEITWYEPDAPTILLRIENGTTGGTEMSVSQVVSEAQPGLPSEAEGTPG